MSLSWRVCAIHVCLKLSRTTLANSACPQILSRTKCAIRVSLEYCHEPRVQSLPLSFLYSPSFFPPSHWSPTIGHGNVGSRTHNGPWKCGVQDPQWAMEMWGPGPTMGHGNVGSRKHGIEGQICMCIYMHVTYIYYI